MTWEEVIKLAEREWGDDVLSRVAQSRQFLQDSDIAIHAPSPELLLVWLSKVLLVNLTMEKTSGAEFSHYGWIDAGHREYQHVAPPQRMFPCAELAHIPAGKMVISARSDACHPQYFRPMQHTCPIGGLWYGDYLTCLFFVSEVSNEIPLRLAEPSSYSLVADQDLYALVGFSRGILHEMNGEGYQLAFHDCSSGADTHSGTGRYLIGVWMAIVIVILCALKLFL